MKVTVLSRPEAERYTQKSPWVHLSIADPFSGVRRPRRACPRKVDALYLQFLDATPEEIENDPERGEVAPFLFNADQAERIVAFLDPHRNAAVDVVVNCEMGISRSSAVANFVLEYLSLGQAPFAPPHYYPNPYVLEVLREAGFRHRSAKPVA
jgi:protein-tyrosine phosphatase